jgi:glycosyltransferase involved in cell wall biosynthesis
MNEKTTVSVVIPSYNSAKTIEHTIRHILSQSAADRIVDVIVVDSSDDGVTKDILAKYEKDKVQVFTSGVRVMPSIQRNIGASKATGDVLCFIDSDAYPAADWIERILEACAKGYKVGGGSLLVPEFQGKNKLAWAQYYLEFNEYMMTGRPRVKRMVPTCNLFCERELFNSVGGIPKIRAAEDTLFCLKVGKIEKVMFIPDIKVYHIFRENSDHYLSNQVLIGKHIYVYRRYYYKPEYLEGRYLNVLYPVFMLAKFARVFMRILVAGPQHWWKFVWSSPLFFKGLRCWGQGFKQGSKEYDSLKGDIVL